jgi:hypothetical protein
LDILQPFFKLPPPEFFIVAGTVVSRLSVTDRYYTISVKNNRSQIFFSHGFFDLLAMTSMNRTATEHSAFKPLSGPSPHRKILQKIPLHGR